MHDQPARSTTERRVSCQRAPGGRSKVDLTSLLFDVARSSHGRTPTAHSQQGRLTLTRQRVTSRSETGCQPRGHPVRLKARTHTAHPEVTKDERPLLVPDGTPLDEATSALIKELRRGNELHAVYWARQLETRYWKYVFRRLSVFACEDVGLANPTAICVVEACRTACERVKAESRSPRPDPNLLVHAVRVLALSAKNRENDDLKNAEEALRRVGWFAEVPEYAVDWHTERGRALYDRDAGLVRWLVDWSQVEPDDGPKDWALWNLRAAVLEGLLDSAKVEAVAERWEQEGRLRYGIAGIIAPATERGVLHDDVVLHDEREDE
jgi:hypothetical protein